MSTDEEVGQRDLRGGGDVLFPAVLKKGEIGSCTAGADCGWKIENDHAELFEAHSNGIGREIADTQLGKNYRVDGDSFTQQTAADESGSP